MMFSNIEIEDVVGKPIFIIFTTLQTYALVFYRKGHFYYHEKLEKNDESLIRPIIEYDNYNIQH